VAYTYLKLVPARFRRRTSDRRICGLRYSMSHFVLYFGTDRRYDHVAHHEILLGPRDRGLLDDIFIHKRLAGDFSLYLHRPMATDPSLTPPGCDRWYVLAPAAASGRRDRLAARGQSLMGCSYAILVRRRNGPHRRS
jgi:phytoene desaturase